MGLSNFFFSWKPQGNQCFLNKNRNINLNKANPYSAKEGKCLMILSLCGYKNKYDRMQFFHNYFIIHMIFKINLI